MFLTHALRAIFRAAVVTGDSLWKYVTLLLSGTPPAVTFISDASTNNLVITPVGDTRPSNFNPYTPGYYSNFFDGTGDYLTVPASTAFTFGTGDFTIEGWFYVNSFGANGFIPFDNRASNSAVPFNIGVFATGYPYLYEGATAPTGSSGITLNTWGHIAWVRTSGVLKMFVNGVSVYSAAYTVNLTGTNCTIGGGVGGLAGYFLNGYMSNFRIVKGTALYTTTFTPSTTPLTPIANTSLLTCQSNRLIDNSTNNFVITKNGDTTVSGFIPFVTPTTANVNTLYSTYFDGTGDYLTVPDNAAWDLGSNNFTIESWVYPTASAAQPMIIGQWTGVYSWAMMLSNDGNRYLRALINYAGYNDYVSSTSLQLNAWNHCAFVRESNTVSLYLNGVRVYTTSFSGIPSAGSSAVSIGGDSSGNQPFQGYLSNTRVVNGTALYSGTTYTVPTTPLTAIANTSLLTCQNATLIDNSTNAFAITSVGQAQPIAQSPFTQVTTALNTTYLGSGYFDGTGDYLTVPDNAALDLSANYTCEAWVYLFNVSGEKSVFHNHTSDNNGIALNINGALPRMLSGNGTWQVIYDSSISITANSWNHIAVTRNSSTYTIWVNGVSGGTATNSTNPTYSGGAQIGRFTSGLPLAFNGYLSNVRIVKGTAVYTANFAPPAVPLTAVTNTQLLTLQTNQPAANKQFIDNSINNFPVTQAGNATQGTFSPYGDNWSVYTSSANSLGFTNSGTGLNPYTNRTFTIEFWINPSSSSGAYSSIISKGITSNRDWAVYINMASSNARDISFYYSPSSGDYNIASSAGAITYDVWQHVAVVSDNSAIKIYVNGTQVASGTQSLFNSSNPSTVNIGRFMDYTGVNSQPFIGYISNLRFVTGTALYTTTFTPSTTPLTAISGTNLLICQNSRFVDNSFNNYAVSSTQGSPSVQRFSPLSPVTQTPQTYSEYFGGTGDRLSIASNALLALGTGDFTIEMWVHNQSTTNRLISWGVTNSPIVSINGSNQLVYDNYGTASLQTSTSTIPLNTWAHVAISRNTGVTRMYINGVVANSTPLTDTNNWGQSGLYIGVDVATTYMTGFISNLRVLKGTGLYPSGTSFTPSTTPLTAITNTLLLTCQSPSLIDNSTNAFAITAVGNTVPRAFNPFGYTNTTGQSYTPALYGGSGYFDGAGDFLSFTGSAATNFYGVNWTIETWVNLNATPANDYTGLIQAQSGINNWIPYIAIEVNINRTITCAVGTSVFYTTTQTVPPNTWAHLALVRSGGVVKLYINGVASSISVTADSPNSNLSFWFGKSDNSPGGGPNVYYYNGYLSNVRIVKGTAVYTSNFVPPSAPLTATAGTTLLLNMDKVGVSDSSRSNDLETVGDAKIAYETPYAGSYYSNFFDGTGDYLSIANSVPLQLGTGDFTIEFWWNGSASGAFTQNIGTLVVSAETGTYRVGTRYNSTNYVYFARGNGASFDELTYNVNVNDGAWHHIACVRTSGVIAMYVDGIVRTAATGSTSISGTCTTSNPLLFGYQARDGTYATGYTSNARIVKGTAVYTANFTPPTAPLTAIAGTSLLTCQSKSFVDNSSNAFTITRNGDVAVRSQNPFQKNTYSSMYFDGTGDRLQIPAANGIVNFGTGDFTVECWIYLITVPTDYPPILTNDNGFYINFRGNGNIALTDVSTVYAITASALTAGSWFHVAIVRNSGSSKVYVNGIGGTAVACTVNFTNNITTYIGGSAAYVSLNGYIADQRVTKSARYTATFTPPTAPLPTA